MAWKLTTAGKMTLFIYILVIAYLLATIACLENIQEQCMSLRSQGHSDIPKSSVLYENRLDRDNDGIACEA